MRSGFFPYRLLGPENAPSLTLKEIDCSCFQDPFIEDTVMRCAGQETVVPLSQLDCALLPNDAPAGIIFHVSKCGSTLVSQLLKCISEVTVYSQPPVFDDLLLASPAVTAASSIRSMRQIGRLLADHSAGRYILKLTSWNCLHAQTILAAFPDTPWIFCIRDPLEVFVSMLDDPEPVIWHQLYGNPSNPFISLIPSLEQEGLNLPQYLSLFYAEFCKVISRQPKHRGKIVQYSSMPYAVVADVMPHFGLTATSTELTEIKRRSSLYSKAPLNRERRFLPDSPQKHSKATVELRGAVDALARPHFENMISPGRN